MLPQFVVRHCSLVICHFQEIADFAKTLEGEFWVYSIPFEKLRFVMRERSSWLFTVLCLVLIAVFGVDRSNAQSRPVPEVGVVADDNKSYFASTYTEVDPLRHSFENSVMKGMVTFLGGDRWKLDLRAKRPLQRIYFPAQSKRSPVAPRVSDEIFYYPRVLGLAEKASARDKDWDWGLKLIYPGQLFAPLVVLASSSEARMVAATNWPPKKVKPLYGAERLTLLYEEDVPVNASVSYEAMVVDVKGNSASGDVPWQLALDRYRAWLDSHMPVPNYPDWMWEGQGFLDIFLALQSPFDIRSIRSLYQNYKHLYPWVLFWGQMTAPGSKICCALNEEMHPDYLPALPDFVREVVAGGGHAGYYSAPYYGTDSGHPRRNLETHEGSDWFLTWIGKNKSYGANSYYVDTLGWSYYGEAAKVMNLFGSGLIPKDSLIEGVTDIYPAASLVAGALAGSGDGRDGFCGAPYKTPETFDRTTFPRFGRYLFGDRLFYGGIANQDSTFWGNVRYWKRKDSKRLQVCGYVSYCEDNGPCEYGTERLAFLLGEKLDVRTPKDNEILDAIIQERIRANWWARRPVYLDTKGLELTSIPRDSKVEITRFRAKDGSTLFAISNPKLVAGLSFRFKGTSIAVPVKKIAIVE